MRNIKNELEENGIAIIRDFATAAECDELRSAIVDVVKNADMGKVENIRVLLFFFATYYEENLIV